MIILALKLILTISNMLILESSSATRGTGRLAEAREGKTGASSREQGKEAHQRSRMMWGRRGEAKERRPRGFPSQICFFKKYK